MHINLFALLIMSCFSLNTLAQQKMVYAQIIGIPDQIIGAEVLSVAYARLAIPVEFKFFPAKRALIESSKGSIDGEVNRIWEIGDEYPSLVRVPTAINVLETVAFKNRGDDFAISKCDDLNTHKVGIVMGIKHAEICAKGVNQLQRALDSEFLMKMLSLRRFDIGVEARLNGLVQIKKLKLDSKLVSVSSTLNRRLLYNYLHSKHKAFIPTLNKVLDKMNEEGEIAAIRERVIERIFGNSNGFASQ